ncbi:MAG TPA: CPBP family intramembrane glutamic endopeptidase [Gemmataceae bacterium]
MPEFWTAAGRMIVAGLILAAAAGLPAALLLRSLRRRGEPLLPPRRDWAVPWTSVEVLGGFLAFVILGLAADALLTQAGFFRWLYGADFPTEPPGGATDDPEWKRAVNLRMLWSSPLAFPFYVAAVLAMAGQSGGGRLPPPFAPSGRLRADLALGYLGWLTLTPAVFLIYAVALAVLQWVFQSPPEQHPLTLLIPGAGPAELVLLGLEIVLLAPVREEFLFRGLLLPALLKHPLRCHVCYAAALALALGTRTGALLEALGGRDWAGALGPAAPALFVLALLPLYLALPRRGDNAALAVFSSAVLFATFHSGVWPSPVPLFVLAAGLGWLTYRSQSLVPAVVVHGLFNAVSGVFLLLGGGA